MKTFQKPLTSGEEAEYIRLLREGSEEEARRAKEILIERNLRLVAHVAKKYQNVDEDMEDLISIGCIGLIKAVDTFDAGKGRLATYACRCIDNAILSQMRLCVPKKLSRAEKKQNGVFWHRFPKTFTSFVPLRTAMLGMHPCTSIVSA